MKEKIKKLRLTPGAWDIGRALINGKAIAVSKIETKAYLVFDDYSFYKDVYHWHFDELKEKNLLSKIDSRVSSVFYTLNEYGVKEIKKHLQL